MSDLASRPVIYDTYSCAGGAGYGYDRAGFRVIGIDNRLMPRYPFEFHQADALEVLDAIAEGREPWPGAPRPAAIHASPPCHDHMRSPMRQQHEHGTGWLLAATRKRLQRTGLPWVIENVPGAPMRVDLRLCGCMFDLDVMRERWFETSWGAFDLRPACHHPDPVVNPMRTKHGPWYRQHGRIPTRDEVAAAFGVPWMKGEEIKQAVPPAYTEYVGRLLLEQMASERAA